MARLRRNTRHHRLATLHKERPGGPGAGGRGEGERRRFFDGSGSDADADGVDRRTFRTFPYVHRVVVDIVVRSVALLKDSLAC